MTETLTRTFTIDRKAGKGNCFPAVATTESPVLRHDYYEVLDMRRADLSRSPLPFIESHHTDRLNIGIAENVRTDGDKLRCDVRLGSSARAQELAQDIRDGVVTGLSIGYSASEPVESGDIDGIPVFRFSFTPHELSAVACPADVEAGFFRSRGKTMEHREKLTLSKEGVETQTVIERERERVADILCIGKEFGVEEKARQAVSSGKSVVDFQAAVRQLLNSQSISEPGIPELGFSRNAGMPADSSRYGASLGRYSITRLLRGLADPKELQQAGLELEISQDMQRERGKGSAGVMVPWEALVTRATTVGGSGGNLVATDHLAGNFIDVLRNRSHVMQLGPTTLTGLVGDVVIPRKTSGTSAYWIAADGADSVTESDPSFDSLSMSPNTVGGATTFSHKLIVQSTPDIEQLVRQDLADMIATEIDAKAIAGDGTGNAPTGVINQTGINSASFAVANPTWAEIVSMETAIAVDNADISGMAYLTTPSIVEHFKITEKFASTGQTIWAEGREHGQGVVNGYRCLSSGNVPAGSVLLGDWGQLLIGFWGGIELAADGGGSNFLKGSVTVRVLADVDFGVRHAESFCLGSN